MWLRPLLQVLYGFLLAAVLALGPPVAFLMLPAAGMFLLLLPLWIIPVIGVLFFGFLIAGRMFYALGVVLVGIALALTPPLRNLAIGSAAVVGQAVKTNAFLQRELGELCAVDLPPLGKASSSHDLLILDDIATKGEQNYDIADTVAVQTGMRVVEVTRVGHEARFYEAGETFATRSQWCSGGGDSPRVNPSPRGSQRKIGALPVDRCVSRTRAADPSRARAPAIILRRQAGRGAMYCNAVEVVERTQSGDAVLGRVHYDSMNSRMYPDLPVPKGVPRNNWLHRVLTEVLQQDFSDTALMAHGVKTKR